MTDEFDLERFVEAQAETYERALEELRAGTKRSHWMWFIFPQVAGLGSSPMAQRYAISGLDEAAAYIEHPVLGPRLLTCTRAMLQLEGRTARQVLGTPDDLKLRSCMTLFARVSHDPAFEAVLAKYYDGRPDEATVRLLGGHAGG